MSLTIAIIARENPSERFLKSLSFAREVIIVLDQEKPGSAHQGKIKYFYRPLDNNYATQRNFALSKSTGDWVLFVDTDEVISSELKREILEKTARKEYSAFFIPRRDLVYHQMLRYGETGRTKILRLARKDAGKFVRPVHEVWRVTGRVGEIRSPLYHIKDHFVSEFLGRIIQYGQLDAPILARENKPFSYFRLATYPVSKFFLNYIFKLGFIDGYSGLFLAYLLAVQSLSVRVFQWTDGNTSSS